MASSVDARLLKSTKFPPEFNQKVDMQHVNLQVMKKWIASRICEILGNEDDVVIELCFNLIEGSRFPDIKSLQIQLTGFLDKDTASFCKELWKLFLSAQSSPQGVPKELLEAKKLELIQEKVEADRVAEDRRRREEADRGHQDVGGRDRRDWGRGGRAGDTWRGSHVNRDASQRDRHGSGRGGDPPRSPRYREPRDRGDYHGKPSGDSYVPGGRGRGGRGRDRDRLPDQRRPSRSPTRSRERSPVPKRRRRSPIRSLLPQSEAPPTKRRRHSDSPSRSPSPGSPPHRGRRRARSGSYTASSEGSIYRSRSPSRHRRTRVGGVQSKTGSPKQREYSREHARAQADTDERRGRRNTSSASSSPRQRESPSGSPSRRAMD